jgi:4-amino-4-deoxy-L-arabinose transferase-like glycosyltransferase
MKGLGWQPSSVFRIALLLALCLILYLPPINSVPFFDKGEPREALEVQYIVTQGPWLFPLKGEGEIPSKPPLFHWTGALFSLIWGETTEATVRFPSLFYATMGVLLVYLFGCRLFDPRVAFLAGVILATTFI